MLLRQFHARNVDCISTGRKGWWMDRSRDKEAYALLFLSACGLFLTWWNNIRWILSWSDDGITMRALLRFYSTFFDPANCAPNPGSAWAQTSITGLFMISSFQMVLTTLLAAKKMRLSFLAVLEAALWVLLGLWVASAFAYPLFLFRSRRARVEKKLSRWVQRLSAITFLVLAGYALVSSLDYWIRIPGEFAFVALVRDPLKGGYVSTSLLFDTVVTSLSASIAVAMQFNLRYWVVALLWPVNFLFGGFGLGIASAGSWHVRSLNKIAEPLGKSR